MASTLAYRPRPRHAAGGGAPQRSEMGDVERAALAGLSARSARLAMAGRRRLRGEELDNRQRDALERTLDVLLSLGWDLEDEDLLSSSLPLSIPDQAERFAFVRMARPTAGSAQPIARTGEELRDLAEAIQNLVKDIVIVRDWTVPDPAAAQRIASVFSRFSRASLPVGTHSAGERVVHTGR